MQGKYLTIENVRKLNIIKKIKVKNILKIDLKNNVITFTDGAKKYVDNYILELQGILFNIID